jgi:hypothetical protein
MLNSYRGYTMKNKKKKLVVLFSLIMLSSFLLYSCYPDYGLSVTDFDTVITVFDENANFKQPTYAMPDTVVHLVDEGTPEEDIDRSKDRLILSTVADNMQALGYERVAVDTTAAAPAFVILIGATSSENYVRVYYPGWGYWGGWGWWGGYPGYGYPGGSATYNYTTGTIFLSMLEPEKINPDDGTYGAVWLARMNGVLSSSVNSNSRIKQRINDAFNQSPYLGAN